jgi:hypothetical protein
MSRYASIKDINANVVPVMSTELLDFVSSDVDKIHSTLFGGSDPSTVVRDLRRLTLRKVTRVITDFKEGEFYWSEDDVYEIHTDRSFNLVRYHKQQISIINTSKSNIVIRTFMKTASGNVKQKSFYAHSGERVTIG